MLYVSDFWRNPAVLCGRYGGNAMCVCVFAVIKGSVYTSSFQINIKIE